MTQPEPRAATGALDDPTVLRAFVARLREGLYVADGDGRLLDASAPLAALVGVPDAAALRGRALDELAAEPTARRDALHGLAPDGAAREVETTWRTAGGATRRVRESVALVRGADGRVRMHGVVLPLDPAGGGTPAASTDEGARAFAPGLRTAGETGGARDALTGCLERTHLHALGERLSRDPVAGVGVFVLRLEAADEPGRASSPAPAEALAETTAERDELRQRIARFLMRHVRGHEPVIRLGDDEFLVVLAGASTVEQVERVARRVQLLALRGAPGPLSIGWAAREHGESVAAVVARASAMRVPVPTMETAEERRRAAESVATTV